MSLICEGTANLLAKVTAHFTIATTFKILLSPYPNNICYCLSDISHSSGYEMVSQCCFNLHFSDD